MARRLLFVPLILLAVTMLAACGTSKSTGDATVAACTADPAGGQPTANGTVTNPSSENSTFALRIGFYDPSGNRVSENVVTVSGVGAGQTGQWQVTGAASAKGPLTCKVMSLNRTSIAP